MRSGADRRQVAASSSLPASSARRNQGSRARHLLPCLSGHPPDLRRKVAWFEARTISLSGRGEGCYCHADPGYGWPGPVILRDGRRSWPWPPLWHEMDRPRRYAQRDARGDVVDGRFPQPGKAGRGAMAACLAKESWIVFCTATRSLTASAARCFSGSVGSRLLARDVREKVNQQSDCAYGLLCGSPSWLPVCDSAA